MKPMNYYIEGFKNYAVFSGRARRKEYWYFVLFSFIVSVVLSIIDDSGTLSGIYSLAAFLPGLGVAIRRLHDIGKSGWWLFIVLIPIVGAILLIVYLARDSQPGSNKYGSSPKEPKEAVVVPNDTSDSNID